jgi:hypothetical protein
VAGDTSGSVRITGPKNLTELGKGKWVGCSYSIPWCDGSGSPADPIGADCGQELSHRRGHLSNFREKRFIPRLMIAILMTGVGEARFVGRPLP